MARLPFYEISKNARGPGRTPPHLQPVLSVNGILILNPIINFQIPDKFQSPKFKRQNDNDFFILEFGH